MKLLKSLLFVLLLSLLAACSLADDITPPPGSRVESVQLTQAPPQGLAFPLTAPDPASGQAIYTESCLPCHGERGLGDGPQAAQLPNPAAPLASPQLARQAAPADWYRMVTQGNIERFMPPFASLSQSQRWDVVAYSFSLSTTGEELDEGRALYEAQCADCHGQNGQGDGPQAAALGASLPDFTNLESMAEQSAADFYAAITSQDGQAMHAFTDELSEGQRWSVASYLRTLGYAPSGEALAASEPGQATQSEAAVDPAETLEATDAISPTLVLATITGTVTNGASGEPISNQTVTLHGFDGMQIVYTQTAVTQADGVYQFEAVEAPPERMFLSYTEYQGATYASNIGSAHAAESPMALDITAFETTTDTSALQVDRLHIFFDFSQPEMVQVIELYLISNPSDKAIVAEQEGGPVTHFSVPDGASGLAFEDGQLGARYLETPGGFADTLPVQPTLGEYQVVYAFNMPYDRKLELVQNMPLPVDSVILLMPDQGVKLQSDQITEAGVRPVQGENYLLYNGDSLEAGSQLELTLSGAPGSGAGLLNVSGSSSSLIVGLGVFGVALILAGVWLYRRERQAPSEPEDAVEGDAPPEESDPDNLIDAIIALDDQYRQGNLPEEAYRQRRAELKERLQALQAEQSKGRDD